MFSEKLGNFEAKVNPELWANIASQVGATTGAAAAGGGMSLLAKAIIGISGAAALTTGVVLWNGSDTEKELATSPKQEITQASNDQGSELIDKTRVTEPVALDNANSEKSRVVDLITTAPENSNTPTIGQEPILVSTPISVPDLSDRILIERNSVAIATPQVDLRSPINTNDQTTVSQAKENDIVELKQKHNVGLEDEPTQQIATIVKQEDRASIEEVEITFPNVFTPNGDGRNDRYYIVNSNVEFKSFEFVVYDRSGKAVMVTKDADFKWTAFDPQTGMYLQKGVYVFVMIAESTNGIQHKKSGTITIE